jgi:cyclopropane fatty-acyl-phospholipid synthase-like methyltransferase
MVEGPPDWNERYAENNAPWDTGQPSSELRRILQQHEIPRGRVLELGCGTGTNAVFLAQQGFEVTAVDISALAIERARVKAAEAGVNVTLATADLIELPDLGPAFPFVFDRGVYHTVRREALDGFLETLARVSAPGGMYLTLAGNANEVRPDEEGPPRVSAETICREMDPLMELIQLREFRFDKSPKDTPNRPRALAWSALFRRKQAAGRAS